MKRLFFLSFLHCSLILSIYGACADFSFSETFATSFGPFSAVNVTGYKSWYTNTQYSCAMINAYNSSTSEEDWLISPALDLSNQTNGVIAFEHAMNYGTAANYASLMTLQITANYTGDPNTTTWTKLTIPTIPTKGSWTFLSSGDIAIPTEMMKANVHIAFKYIAASGASADACAWEVKNLTINATCVEGDNPDNPSNPDDENIKQLPLALPNLGTHNVRVFAQNLRNYFFDYSSDADRLDRSDCKDADCFAEKTHDIVDVFRFADADVYAVCEVETSNDAVAQLVDSLNVGLTNTPYAYVSDMAQFDEGMVKSAFIYRSDRVKPVGYNSAASTQFTYRNQMRIQEFKDLETNQPFTLSMNHFKAKDNTEDKGNAKRVTNANSLLDALKSRTGDILIVGDLNCEVGEEPLNLLQNAGYEEQLLRFDADAISHCFDGGELIDHAYANESLAAKISGAAVYHICTKCTSGSNVNYDYRYSDHDPLLIGIQFETKEEEDTPCQDIAFTESFDDGLAEFISGSVLGEKNWYCDNTNHYAKISGYQSSNEEDWLISPAFDLAGMHSATLSFSHTSKFGDVANMKSAETLWISNDYENGLPNTASWTQLTIPTYPAGTDWTFVNSGDIAIPADFLSDNMHFAFKYVAATSDGAQTWEIDNIKLTAICQGTSTDLVHTNAPIITTTQGQITIHNAADRSLTVYNLLGQSVVHSTLNGSFTTTLSAGLYIIQIGEYTTKVLVP